MFSDYPTEKELTKKVYKKIYSKRKLVDQTREFFGVFKQKNKYDKRKYTNLKILILGTPRQGKTAFGDSTVYGIIKILKSIRIKDFKLAILKATSLLEEAIQEYPFTRKHFFVVDSVEEAVIMKADAIWIDELGIHADTGAKHATSTEGTTFEEEMRIASHKDMIVLGMTQSFSSYSKQLRSLMDIIITKGGKSLFDEERNIPKDFKVYEKQISELKQWESFVWYRTLDMPTCKITTHLTPHWLAEEEWVHSEDNTEGLKHRFSQPYQKYLASKNTKSEIDKKNKLDTISMMVEDLLDNGYYPKGEHEESKRALNYLTSKYAVEIPESDMRRAIRITNHKITSGFVEAGMTAKEKKLVQEKEKSRHLIKLLTPNLNQELLFNQIEGQKVRLLQEIATQGKIRKRDQALVVKAYNYYGSLVGEEKTQQAVADRFADIENQQFVSYNFNWLKGKLANDLGYFIQEKISHALMDRENIVPVYFPSGSYIGEQNEPDLVLTDNLELRFEVYEIKSSSSLKSNITFSIDDFFTSLNYLYSNILGKIVEEKNMEAIRGLDITFYLISVNYELQTIRIYERKEGGITLHH